MFDFIKNISPTEIIILVLILIVLFGAKAIVTLGRTSGKAVKEIKKIKRRFNETIEDDDNKPSQN
ncbi:MAG: twin-arginine translocase TatA/TatE family subunit [Candidatus Daviesbacteria bacterium]